MDATQSAMLQTLWSNYQRYGFRIGVTPPLSKYEANQCQHITLDPSQLPQGFFFAEILGNTGLAYTWVERVETVAGTWANGTQAGTLNARYAQPGTPVSTVVAAGTVAIMRQSPGVQGAYEFLLVSGGTLLTGNTATEASGSTADMATTELRAATSRNIRIRGDSGIRTVAAVFPGDPDGNFELTNVATYVCPTKKKYNAFVTIAGTDYPVTFTEITDFTPAAIEFVSNITLESSPLSLPPGSVGDATCITDPTGCCGIHPLGGCCPETTLPRVFRATTLLKEGFWAFLPDTWTMVYDPVSHNWDSIPTPPILTYEGSAYEFRLAIACTTPTPFIVVELEYRGVGGVFGGTSVWFEYELTFECGPPFVLTTSQRAANEVAFGGGTDKMQFGIDLS